MITEQIKVSVEADKRQLELHTYFNPSDTLFDEICKAYDESDFHKDNKCYILIQQMKPYPGTANSWSVNKTAVKNFG